MESKIVQHSFAQTIAHVSCANGSHIEWNHLDLLMNNSKTDNLFHGMLPHANNIQTNVCECVCETVAMHCCTTALH